LGHTTPFFRGSVLSPQSRSCRLRPDTLGHNPARNSALGPQSSDLPYRPVGMVASPHLGLPRLPRLSPRLHLASTSPVILTPNIPMERHLQPKRLCSPRLTSPVCWRRPNQSIASVLVPLQALQSRIWNGHVTV